MTTRIQMLNPGDEMILDHVSADLFDSEADIDLAAELINTPRNHLIVAVENGLVVGMCFGVHYVPDKRPELCINELCVAPAYRRRGIGKRLVKAMLEFGRLNDFSRAWALTGKSNTATIRLFKSAGGRQRTDAGTVFTFELQNSR
ncbi:MAG: GNAT family N-acetyltransferase [Desulfobacterales bacterium]|nr:GNAT family N-acetyltransferase [Desulfobacterales bacterium]MDD4071919.1 GNAT family N-acetyltransferase [Desulfobacterales bacterium]MDD4393921.1 GNAT family N-acetyltransferase [Desulfobacterales bacterium]